MRHSALTTDPSGVPSSKKARRYQSPSHAVLLRARPSGRRRGRATRSARARSPRASASRANSQRVVCRNQPSQTLSPRPSGADAVHAVVPVARADQGQAVRADGEAPVERAGAVLEQRAVLGGDRGLEVRVVAAPSRAAGPSRKGTTSSSTAASPVDLEVLRDGVGQPDASSEIRVRTPRPGGGMPPVLHVALHELAAAARRRCSRATSRFATVSAITSWSWSRNPYAPPGLIEGGSGPDPAGERLVEKPAVEHDVHGAVRRLDLDGADDVVPPSLHGLQA